MAVDVSVVLVQFMSMHQFMSMYQFMTMHTCLSGSTDKMVASHVTISGLSPGLTERDLYVLCTRGAQGVLPCEGRGVTASQLDLPSLTPLSVAGCGRLQLEAAH